MSEEGEVRKFSKMDGAAILLMTLGEADAARILRHMGPKEVQRIGSSMAALRNITQEEVEGVLMDFLGDIGHQTGVGIGSDEYIKNMLTEALGADKAATILDRILDGGGASGLDSLKWMDSRAVAEMIRYEHPQIQAIVISYLDADQSADVLSTFDEKVRLDIMMRVASLDSVQPQALAELNSILEQQFAGNASTSASQIGGVKCAADIMNFMDSTIEGDLMDSIREIDADLGNEIEDLMFVFENLKDVDDRGIQTMLREISSDLLILALKGADDELQDKIFSNMSSRAADLLRDDLEAKGPVKVSEVETAQKEILTIARRLADAGEIVLGGSGEEML